ncbi:competence ComEA helix-hairpin-helix repeat region domain protein [Mycolicibacterium hassiacum DSM 44199]|jgi:competence protein ComEA|uniref:Competence ComEA helix-hairpin-helix repeat region domain protein n=1 Tax=Mycolicibacterium hassiacum (strain DSM 44199 / CIP 105218 / JCM 12690 / 3849) TaxID=1122247 RepID=K5BEM4_MYCHD|nr:ComEA family DNA-binding protein [Mycolicibacterium hassiacum]EKF23132.1 competence ComEA helix-hairpin-helix repeat region domain protein [Mycolicibacterium hassiacum DSM 44199]MBX5486542.1 ComEA family DNA-binding protein [Mycolicibacterium hassiacum]MDA4086509.1 membrane protein [Mycolicibacterium hassiacum DSM 44199]VCT89590.1 ComE operon protein 1 [Mycolicibacterium hassiacum DSM 44199]
MGTERSAERLQRRAGAESESRSEDTAVDTGPVDVQLSRWLPDTDAGAPRSWLAAVRADPGRAGVIALSVVGAFAVLVTLFTLMRDQPPAVASAHLPPVEPVSSTAARAPGPAGDPAQPVVVSVVGLVHKPGLVTLDPGARIADALAAAGGPLDGADLVGLNMARRVADGEQIVVGIAPPPGQPAVMGSSITPAEAAPAGRAPDAAGATGAGTAGGTTTLDLNTATVEQLDSLPGIGPVTAAAIVAWRDAHGRFTSVEQLAEVDGIGPARLEKLRALVHV